MVNAFLPFCTEMVSADFLRVMTGTLPSLPISHSPPPKIPPPVQRSALERLTSRPLITSLVATGIVGSSVFIFLYPPRFIANLPYVGQLVPRSRRPLPIPPRPRKASDGSGVRLEAVLVLGAERDTLARHIALDLEMRGFVVLATVSSSEEVEGLEREGRGFIKGLSLDPADVSSLGKFFSSFTLTHGLYYQQLASIPAFLRSLSTALSLRFPLHSPGDPFRPSHQIPSLSALINGLPLVSPPASLAPLEAQHVPSFSGAFDRRVLTSIGVVQGCLPFLRQSREADGVVLTLVPSATARVSLPFRAVESACDAALVAAVDSLRREILLSEKVKGGVRVVTLDVGFFHLPSGSLKPKQQQHENENVEQLLPGHLRGIYSSSLERRVLVSSDRGGNRHGRRKTDASKLTKKIFNIIVKGHGGRRSSVGAGCT
jgi:hypothetical protein